jgi:hypothetical protein
MIREENEKTGQAVASTNTDERTTVLLPPEELSPKDDKKG